MHIDYEGISYRIVLSKKIPSPSFECHHNSVLRLKGLLHEAIHFPPITLPLTKLFDTHIFHVTRLWREQLVVNSLMYQM